MIPRIDPHAGVAPQYVDYLHQLKKNNFNGDIRTDYAARLAVANDNSIYQVIPQAVVFPRSTEDIIKLFTLSSTALFQTIQFAPRGGGTGTNGQSLSAGIIVDCSKYLNAILELNLAEKWVRVQPGVVLDQLNQFLLPHGVYFPPEISPSNRATIGGMINTDACGNGSKLLGRTSDHVLNLTCILTNGEQVETERSPTTLTEKIQALLHPQQALIAEKFFNAPRTLCGYNLAKAKQHLNYLFCGSEGTLAIVSECKLKLTALPRYKKLLVIKYRCFSDALNAREITPDIQPLVIESIDEKLIALARQEANYWQIKDWIAPASAINLVEFVADDEALLQQQITKLCANIENSPTALGYYLAKNENEIKLLWDLRKRSVGLISKKCEGARRPIPFIEDTAVPPEKLADYIADLKALLDRHQLIYGMYGHTDAGCIHVRPALDMRTQDEKLIRTLSDEVVALVKKYGGVMWGEHGKGYRSEYGVTFLGEKLYEVVRQIKTWFDPHNQLNPGKIAVPFKQTTNLVKLDEHFRGQLDRQIPLVVHEDYANATACNGNGACFNYATQDVMCPSFKVTQDRIHSPKGRASVVREWLRQLAQLNYSFTKSLKNASWLRKCFHHLVGQKDFSHEVHAALAGCLACKACTTQCPLNVDVPDFKARFLSHYYTRYLRPLRDYFVAYAESLAYGQACFPQITNKIIRFKPIQYALSKGFHLLNPPLLNVASIPKTVNQQPTLILIQDAWTSFYEGSVLENIYRFFTYLGFRVDVAPFFPNGKPLHVKGFLPAFSKTARQNIQRLRTLAAQNIPLIGIDPSMTLTYRDEYQKLLENEQAGYTVQLPQEFLAHYTGEFPKVSSADTYYLLSHCTEKTALSTSEQQWQTVFARFGLTLRPLAAGCCGMAGAYGHEAEHFASSKQLFAMDWQRHLMHYPNILATGYSCRSQVKRFHTTSIKHPLEILTTLLHKETL